MFICPFCKTALNQTGVAGGIGVNYRRYSCSICQKRFTTRERLSSIVSFAKDGKEKVTRVNHKDAKTSVTTGVPK